ncbi:PH domain-containing protein [Blastococcus xanthinilyticus]|uniref:PH domain-containing protein n=1 Tax=Blastococcus xanthinilyticus TaxID=1564164 RepID=UPI001FB6B29C|nr:PH domain-containing protein [Blastococcus xanthinilyticus]
MGTVQWSPPVLVPAALALAGLALAAVAVLLDPAGRVLVGGAALLMLAMAAREAVLRPRLAAGADGVEVRTLTGRRLLPWGVLRVRVRTARRWGTTIRTLELETWPRAEDDDGVLVVLGRWDLGADPEAVARALEAHGRGAV